MQSLRLGGLWHCLCPTPNRTSLISQCGFVPIPICVKPRKKRKFGTASHCALVTPAKLWLHQQRTRACLNGWLAIHLRPKDLQRNHYHDQRRYRRQETGQADIDRLYDELHTSHSKGQYEFVQSIIRKLVEDHHQEPDLRLYEGLILSNADPQNGSAAAVEEILEDMGNEGIVPDSAIYHAILKVLSIHPNYLFRAEILEAMRQRWFTLTDHGWHDFIAGLIRDRQIESAIDTLYMLHDAGKRIEDWLHDLFAYTLCDLEEFDEVLYLMRYRENAGEYDISPGIWSHILDTASQSFNYEATSYAWRKRVETGFLNPSLGMCINVIDTAARHGDSRLASEVFRVFRERNYTPQIYHYEALIEAFASGPDAKLESATEVLLMMVGAGVAPAEGSTRPIFLLLKQFPKLIPDLTTILEKLKTANRPIPPPLVNLILEAYISQKNLSAALEFYKTRLNDFLPSGPTMQTIHIMLRCCHVARRKDIATFLAQELLRLKMRPTSETFDYLILASLYGLPETGERPEQGWDDAWRYFVDMHNFGFTPSLDTYEALATKGCEVEDDKVWRLIAKRNEDSGMEDMEVELRVRRVIGRHEDRGGKLRTREPLEKIDKKIREEKARAGLMMEISKKAANLFV